MSEERIPGTRVPDTPIHRASLWLEDLKYAERREQDPGVEHIETELYELLIRELELDLTPGQLLEAAVYYGSNLESMFGGGRIQVVIPSPTGEGVTDLRSLFISAWLDGWMHGAATQKGLRGESTEERAS